MPTRANVILGGATRLFNWLEGSGLGNTDWRKGNLSMTDFASRASLLCAWYVPQTIISIRHQTHPWENFGRNLTVFLMTLGILSYTKNDRYSLNTLVFDRWMKPAKLGGDYFELLKTAGIDFCENDRKKAFWTKLDFNQIAKLDDFVGKLQPDTAVDALLPWEQRVLGKLSQTDKQRLHALGTRFLKRLNGLKLASTGLIVVALALLVGQLAMEFVFRTFARLDKDFNPEEFKQRRFSDKPAVAASRPAERLMPPSNPPLPAAFPPPSAQASLPWPPAMAGRNPSQGVFLPMGVAFPYGSGPSWSNNRGYGP